MEDISKNYAFIMIIDSLKHKTILSIKHDQQDNLISPLEQLVKNIRDETE